MMDNTNNIDQLIDAYLLDQLSEPEVDAFQKAMASDQSLMEKVAMQKLIIKGVQRSGSNKLKERLRDIHKDVAHPSIIKKRIWPGIVGVAASIAILLTALFVINQKNAPSSYALYEKNYRPYKVTFGSRSEANDAHLTQISSLYNSGKYAEAMPFIQKALKDSPSKSILLMSAGVCAFEIDDLASARNYFKQIVNNNDLRLSDQASWYIALSYLKENKISMASKWLQRIIDNPFADQLKSAQELYMELNDE